MQLRQAGIFFAGQVTKLGGAFHRADLRQVEKVAPDLETRQLGADNLFVKSDVMGHQSDFAAAKYRAEFFHHIPKGNSVGHGDLRGNPVNPDHRGGNCKTVRFDDADTALQFVPCFIIKHPRQLNQAGPVVRLGHRRASIAGQTGGFGVEDDVFHGVSPLSIGNHLIDNYFFK